MVDAKLAKDVDRADRGRPRQGQFPLQQVVEASMVALQEVRNSGHRE